MYKEGGEKGREYVKVYKEGGARGRRGRERGGGSIYI